MDDLEPAAAEATPQDMTEFMESAFDELESEEAPEPEVSEVSEEQIATVVEAETNSDDAPVSDEPTDAGKEAEDEPVEEQATVTPQSMSAKDLEAFAQLSPESQKWVTDREKELTADYTRKTMDLAEQKKGYERLEEVLAPRRQQFAMDGMDDSTVIGQLLAYSDFANNDPVGFAKTILNARNIPLTALTEPGAASGPVDPQIAAMQQKMQGFENILTQQQHNAQQQESIAIDSDLQKFAKENEHYAELQTDMIPLVRALRESNPNLSNADNLAKAYKMAIAANDSVSGKVEAAKSAKAQVDKVAMEKARAAKAAKAAGANVSSAGSRPAGKAGAENVDDFIGALVEERMTA